ncbi:Glucosamine-phosphate N-acetyltransferase [Handroanthus impetiginosus]|uniref:Glucosamine-phosphate N-acetyltransferase n=1 Tax=Handroanthus impetiginosus TaxID=429701 RepID=A0A2G9GIA4_9LAMI|nr:Glucosamine-phosphate N-acetyltransferase [Handroanthus impetiginosus]
MAMKGRAMAAAAAVHGGYPPTKLHSSLPSPLRIAARIKPNTAPPPISISTNPAHANLHHLKELYAICNHSCQRFPNTDAAGRVEPVDVLKLRTAIAHSSVVVSAFTKPEFLTNQSSTGAEVTSFTGIGGYWITKVAPVTPANGTLIGFGRAVSDLGLTASIYDVTVHPALRRRGIGRMIVQRIVRMLTNRDIYDIAALCSHDQRPFFKACGFGDDTLGSTTMVYTRSPSSYSKDEEMISAGGKLLLFPSPRELTK